MKQLETANGSEELAHGPHWHDKGEGNQRANYVANLPERQKRKSQQAAANTVCYKPQPSSYAHVDESAIQEEQYQTGEKQTPITPPRYDEGDESGEFAREDLWEEFFTIGPEFNCSDWDTFLIDLDEQMSGMGSNSQ
jgi:hypothetical protein